MTAHLGRYYTDVETGQQRETDVCASVSSIESEGMRGGPAMWGHLVIECKSARDKPWILFTEEQHSTSEWDRRFTDQRFALPDPGWLLFTTSPFWDGGPVPLVNGYRPFGHTLVRALGTGNDDVAYGAVRSVAKAAAGVRIQFRQEAEVLNVKARAIVFPVLLIDAPLFQCELDEDGQERLTRIDRGTLVWRYQLASDLPHATLVTVITTPALPDLADDLKLTVASLKRGCDVPPDC
ncbi:hypothetical protein [Nocardia colli]|uniref:hypothetical protein n=1 Tax=Nocardia colli TaxID=2545717 RepID=UPI0035D5FACA